MVAVGGTFEHSTETIANKLGAKTGPDLVIAAAAHLHFAKDKTKFTRPELLEQMQTATGHYKRSFHNNMSSNLNGLTKSDRLRSFGGGTYSLSKNEAEKIEGAC